MAMIYMAAPLFSDMERDYIDNLTHDISRELNLDPIEDFYLPHRDNLLIGETIIYEENIKNLNNCDLMIAVLDGKDVDSGTAFEIGYFEAQDKTVLGILTDTRSYDENGDFNLKLNSMIFGSLFTGNLIFNNFDCLINELYTILMED